MEGADVQQERIAIMGSAFDPIHFAHCAIALLVLHEQLASEVWLCPCPERWDKTPLATASLRLQWTSQATETLAARGWRIRTSDVEIRRGAYQGSYELLRSLHAEHPSKTFTLVVGEDAYKTIPQWRNPLAGEVNGQKLLEEFELIVMRRQTPQKDESTCPDVPATLETHGRSMPVVLPTFHDRAAFLQSELGQDAGFLARMSSGAMRQELARFERAPDAFIFTPIARAIARSQVYRTKRPDKS